MPTPLLNVAATCVGTHALGPGRRSVVWVQGCPFDCTGCVAPEWIPQRTARLADSCDLAAELLSDPDVTGLTFSGGEPMLQAEALAAVARHARRTRDVDVVCFTGFTLERLRTRPPSPGVADLLGEVDVLIDGVYVAARDDGRGLRGSTNQRIHRLTGRLSGFDFEGAHRQAELHISGGEVLMVGVPPRGLLPALDDVTGTVTGAEIGSQEETA
ncbi:4Fe-4S single cluster domain-containing protein [Hamadaea tsunoensis]|uniref:4Fe-4S single cluster domain-containing protein n=1 Tax=Hamadaea tsunoensis TaxID=53368 RepID=UPI000684800E|nr:4Fe-4S single cluster domain-containing protein [Hamadaea tsunoensis]